MKATTAAPAKINLALVVGPRREDGKHEIVTVYERIALEDTLTLEPADRLEIDGFPADTLVTLALTSLAEAAGVEPRWRVGIEKRIPVGAGLGGGSSDAAAALRLANASLAEPLDASRLHELAAALGADVPLFLTSGPQLGEGDGTELTPARASARLRRPRTAAERGHEALDEGGVRRVRRSKRRDRLRGAA